MYVLIFVESDFVMLDWVIVVIYLFGIVCVGLFVNCYICDMVDYIVVG